MPNLYNSEWLEYADIVWFGRDERDADHLIGLGLVGTCVPDRFDGWRSHYAEELRGKCVYIAGTRPNELKAVLDSIKGVVSHAQLINLPFGVDSIADYIKADNDPRDLLPSSDQMPNGYRCRQKTGSQAAVAIADYWRGPGAVEIFDWSVPLPSFRELRPLHPGDLVVVMGYTGSCKTLLMQWLSLYARCRVAWFELELSEELFWERIYAMHNRTGTKRINGILRGTIKPDGDNMTCPNHITADCTSGLRVDEIAEQIKIANDVFDSPVGIVVVDYLQLARGPGSSKYEQMSTLAEDMRIMAKNLNCAVMLASQVARPPERKQRPIGLFDAKDSGSIENSASHVIGINSVEGNRNRRKLDVIKCTTGGEGMTTTIDIDWGNMTISDCGPTLKSESDWSPVSMFSGEDI